MMPSSLVDIVTISLHPRLAWIQQGKPETEQGKLRRSFEQHVQLLADILQLALVNNSWLTIEFFVHLHQVLFPAGHVIRAVGNDGVAVEMQPGEWRKQVLFRRQSTNTDFSQVEDIEWDFRRLLLDCATRLDWKRADVLRFYFLFGNVHPFGDANGTISALACDVLCFRHRLAPLWLLNTRFKNKPFLFHLIRSFENDRSPASLKEVLEELDEFNKRNPLCELA